MWFAIGSERGIDGAKIVARTAIQQGVIVRWEEFEGMPHLWPFLFKGFKQARVCLEVWAAECIRFTEGERGSAKSAKVENARSKSEESTRHGPIKARITSEGKLHEFDGKITELNVGSLTDITIEKARKLMRQEASKLLPWTGTTTTQGRRLTEKL